MYKFRKIYRKNKRRSAKRRAKGARGLGAVPPVEKEAARSLRLRYKAQKNQAVCLVFCFVAEGGLEPPTSGL